MDDDARLTVGTPVAPDDVVGIECDVLAPCADRRRDQRRHRSTSCAAASSPARPTTSSPIPSLADRLHERGILYAPDYVINAGGVLHGAGLESLGWDGAQVDERLRGIGTLLLELYADDGSPVHAADRLVERRLRA